MAEKLDDKELVSFEELLRANSIQVDALSQLYSLSQVDSFQEV
jgi:hypothetical protein